VKKIFTDNDEIIKVDDEDYPYLNRFLWCTKQDENRLDKVVTFVAWHKGKSIYVPMGKFLLDTRNNDNHVILHKNGDSLDFRKSNLLLGSLSEKKIRESKYNFVNKTPTSKYKGVWKSKPVTPGNTKLWHSAVRKDNEKHHLGGFYTEREAAQAYNEKAKELYGELAYQNKLE